MNYEIGQIVSGTVKALTPFGFFVDLGGGDEGLVHVTELPTDPGDEYPNPYAYERGSSVSARVIEYSVRPDRVRISLSMLGIKQPSYIEEH